MLSNALHLEVFSQVVNVGAKVLQVKAELCGRRPW